MAIFSTLFFLSISRRSFRDRRDKVWEIKTLTVSAKNRIQNMSILMEGNVSAPQGLGGCQYIKTLGTANPVVLKCPCAPSPRGGGACEISGPTLSFRFSGSGGGKYVLLLVVEGSQHPCSKHLPFSSSCLLTSGLCQDCFPWSTSSESASFFNTVLEKFLFQKLSNF